MRPDIESPCPLNRDEDNAKARAAPYNAASAFCFQFHDTVRTLYGCAHSKTSAAFKSHLKVLQAQLDAAKQIKDW